MYYRLLLILFLLISSALAKADAADSRYRVEILVLTHLEHDQPAAEAAVLRNFSDALDFLTPPPADDATPPESSDVTADAATAESLPGEALAPPKDPEAEPVCTVVHVPDMGPEMQDAWRRLRLSRPYRPLQYLAWEQPGVAPFPELRIHDLESVFTEDPWLHLREPETGAEEHENQAGGSAAGLFSSQESGDSTPGFFSGPETDDEGAGAGPLPPPIQYFRLDGKAQLVRTRFLHLALEVEWREPVFDPESVPAEPVAPESVGGVPDRNAAPQPTSFLIHRLAQRRQVKTGRMEYFDGPVLSVLAFITDISDTDAEANPDP